MSFVYFIATADRSLVKIGVSDDVSCRLGALRSSSPDRGLFVLAVVPGDERYERALHERFASLRSMGEWFHLDGELATLLALLPSVDTAKPPPRGRARRHEKRMSAMPTDEQRKEMSLVVDEIYVVLRAAIQEVGLNRFAAEVGVHRSHVVQSLNRNFRRFPSEWMHGFSLASETTRLRIVNLIRTGVGMGPIPSLGELGAVGSRLVEDEGRRP